MYFRGELSKKIRGGGVEKLLNVQNYHYSLGTRIYIYINLFYLKIAWETLNAPSFPAFAPDVFIFVFNQTLLKIISIMDRPGAPKSPLFRVR